MTEPGHRCPLCSTPDSACGPAGAGGRPVDLLVTTPEGNRNMSAPAEKRWVNMATRSGRENWALLNLRPGDPQYEGSLAQSEHTGRPGGVVVREIASNKARGTDAPGRPARKTTPKAADKPADTKPPE